MLRRLLLNSFLHLAILVLATGQAFAKDNAETRHSGVSRVVVFADVHGAYENLTAILRQVGIIDERNNWSGGDSYLVSTGDILDRGPRSREALDLLMSLQTQAGKTGGRVLLALGNHEMMNMIGDWRYVSEQEIAGFADDETVEQRQAAYASYRRQPGQEALSDDQAQAEFDEQYPAGYFARLEAFSPQGKYGSWLLEQAVVHIVNDTLFAHGGLAPVISETPLAELNQTLMAEIRQYAEAWHALHGAGYVSSKQNVASSVAIAKTLSTNEDVSDETRLAAVKLLAANDGVALNTNGPLWYRGSALCYPLSEGNNTIRALQKQQVQRAVLGHTITASRKVENRDDGRIILLDTGMLTPVYGGRTAALIIDEHGLQVSYLDHEGLEPPLVQTRKVGARPNNMTDDELAEFLRTASVIGSEAIPVGVTQPTRLTLEKDGVQLQAIFKTESTEIRRGRGPNKNRMLNISDRWQYEVAAYRLDRLLGLDMVPVAVERNINGEDGALIFWMDGLISLLKKNREKISADGWCRLQPQHDLMYVWDTLIYNDDRTQQNVTYTQDDWMLKLIDQSRSFRTYRNKPPYVRERELRMTQKMADRLAALDSDQLSAELGAYVNRDQIRALLKRRDSLINNWAEIQSP
ncbi:MAG: metallophosphoesterase [Gammaproteobacteria bacterium]|nr:metallophosphoesterase [Gammaproteobacteria bacterium]